MSERLLGYWTLSWLGLFSNIVALPLIALIIIYYRDNLVVANWTLAISVGWPAAIVGIISSSALLAEKRWGITLTLVSLSMVIAASLPYSIVRLIKIGYSDGIGILTLLVSFLNLLALVYWCLPKHRRKIRY